MIDGDNGGDGPGGRARGWRCGQVRTGWHDDETLIIVYIHRIAETCNVINKYMLSSSLLGSRATLRPWTPQFYSSVNHLAFLKARRMPETPSRWISPGLTRDANDGSPAIVAKGSPPPCKRARLKSKGAPKSVKELTIADDYTLVVWPYRYDGKLGRFACMECTGAPPGDKRVFKENVVDTLHVEHFDTPGGPSPPTCTCRRER